MLCPRCSAKMKEYKDGTFILLRCPRCQYPVSKSLGAINSTISFASKEVKRDRFVISNVTDVDMLKIHIDIALDKRDKTGFEELVYQLKQELKKEQQTWQK